ncbi:hypothetical protein O6H91_07G076400 [Diphasiastrum complanatum]|uniref:Uncharacterized protein n=4 Tax=Diphasiastrum complanatum TaxID=34168 RepID=A0ACC2D725_DIPCM|nr:hypothetical protein O6H91_07G076400 [Diphasiastrum complanatum]KAJ7549968.1 hypothetical protein O6H91_07G076400 [Diphasiastrum complanatum]KAJ7549969.1 hypothetical protein O6H91_07G076400 [Diphasiastrum complanatum]KAJ7549970.1 hypothetical protein O6H91_07G076400 [Diphasiastrum complanatum]
MPVRRFLLPLEEDMFDRSGRARAMLTPLIEGPIPEQFGGRRQNSLKNWMKEQLEKTTLPLLGNRRTDLRLLLGVLGSSLGPFAVGKPPPSVSPKDSPIDTSSAQYIVQQYVAATGGSKLQSTIRSSYALGKIKMIVSEFETAGKISHNHTPAKTSESGGFVLWQIMPDKWHVELALSGSKLQAGCDGKVMWRHTPWSGSQAAKGPIRPLRRALQGLDPRVTASMFSNARCIGEKRLGEEDCFILKLAADSISLAARSNSSEEIIRHVLLGYFSQKTGLLLQMEDSHLIRLEDIGGETVYLETIIESILEDYKPVEGLTIAHSGRIIVRLFKFGESSASHTKTRLEEIWTIDEVAYNVPGLSNECFIPPADVVPVVAPLITEFPWEASLGYDTGGARLSAIETPLEEMEDILWRTEV